MKEKKNRSLAFYVAIILGVGIVVALQIMLIRRITGDNERETADSIDKDNISTDSASVSDLDAPMLNGVTNVDTGVKITWEEVDGAEMYRVYYKTGSGGWTEIADVSDTSYIWTGAESGTDYAFTVRCVSSDGESATSDYDRVGMSITYIAAPHITAVNITNTGAKIAWEEVDGAEQYRVFYKTDSADWITIADVADVSYVWAEAEEGMEYTFTVRCISSGGENYTSSYDTTGKSIKFVATPQISDVANVDDGIEITWEAVSGAEQYRVYYKTESVNWTRIAEVKDTSYVWAEAEEGVEYTFTVRCASSDGSFTSKLDSTGKSIIYSTSH